MQMQWKSISRRLLTASAGLLLPLAMTHSASAATIGTSTLTVSATVTSYITVAFGGTNVTGGVTGNAGNSYAATATLNFGSFNYGSTTSSTGDAVSNGVTLGSCTGCIEVTQPVTLTVTAYDLNSTGYTISANLGTADTTDGWALGSTTQTLANGSNQTIAPSGSSWAYNTTNNLNVYLAVPTTTGSSAPSSVTNTINMILTAQ